jgi:hypothetical protein
VRSDLKVHYNAWPILGKPPPCGKKGGIKTINLEKVTCKTCLRIAKAYNL